VIGGNAVETLRAGSKASKDVSAADHDGHFDAEFVNIFDLVRDAGDDVGIDAEALLAAQSFSPEF